MPQLWPIGDASNCLSSLYRRGFKAPLMAGGRAGGFEGGRPWADGRPCPCRPQGWAPAVGCALGTRAAGRSQPPGHTVSMWGVGEHGPAITCELLQLPWLGWSPLGKAGDEGPGGSFQPRQKVLGVAGRAGPGWCALNKSPLLRPLVYEMGILAPPLQSHRGQEL